MDSILTVSEIIDDLKRSGKPSLVVKADFEKAFDYVNWNYLDTMMTHLGFCGKWKSWIKECLYSSTISVLINCRGIHFSRFVVESCFLNMSCRVSLCTISPFTKHQKRFFKTLSKYREISCGEGKKTSKKRLGSNGIQFV